jgi:hypothetical protein
MSSPSESRIREIIREEIAAWERRTADVLNAIMADLRRDFPLLQGRAADDGGVEIAKADEQPTTIRGGDAI